MSKMTNCKTCGKEIAANAKTCPFCGAKNKPPIYKRIWFWLLIVFIVIPAIVGIFGSEENDAPSSTSAIAETAPSSSETSSAADKDEAFAGDCGISASAEMGSSVIGYPELTVSITNTTNKDISAIQFYAVPCDVYGDEITGWTSQNKLYTDTSIGAGESTSITYQFIEDTVKTVELYVYSVYFADGTEWGDKDATKSAILKNGTIIEVSGES